MCSYTPSFWFVLFLFCFVPLSCFIIFMSCLWVRELTLLFSHLQRQRSTKKVLHNSYHTLLSGLRPYSSPYLGDRYATETYISYSIVRVTVIQHYLNCLEEPHTYLTFQWAAAKSAAGVWLFVFSAFLCFRLSCVFVMILILHIYTGALKDESDMRNDLLFMVDHLEFWG